MLKLYRASGSVLSALILCCALSASLLIMPQVAYADTNNFTVTNFAADYYLSNNDPQGEMRIVERINVVFTDQNHGLLRALPQDYSGRSLHLHVNKVTSDSSAPVKYTTYTSNGNKVLKIGDPNRTVTGAQEYTIDYTVDNVIKFFDNKPQLYWNVNGVGWDQSFEHVSAAVHLANGLHVSTAAGQSLICISGSVGGQGSNCSITSDGSILNVDTTQSLGPNENLTMVAGFDSGYFHPETLSDRIGDLWRPVAALLILPLAASAYCLRVWRKLGRDPKGQGTVVPRYDVPDDLSPVEVGALVDFKVDNRDITALLISLAIRKYVRIVETDTKKLLRGTTVTYELILLRTDYTGLSQDEIRLLSALFVEPSVGKRLELKAAGASLYKAAADIQNSATEHLTTTGYFRSNPVSAGNPLLWVLLFIVIGGSILALFVSLTAIAGGLIAGIITAIFWKFMPARTAKGVSALEQINGLKLYIQTAEADRIKMMQSPNAPYAQNSHEPVRDVELFEKLLPYAMVLGVEKDWAKQFENLYVQPPEWYAGNYAAFSTGYLIGSLNGGFNSAVQSSFTPPSSSSSSGFGGGGFSGGGGGGGGGGGW